MHPLRRVKSNRKAGVSIYIGADHHSCTGGARITTEGSGVARGGALGARAPPSSLLKIIKLDNYVPLLAIM